MSQVMEPWYAAKCIFKHNDLKTDGENAAIYEERIILVKADNEDSAIDQAEKEAGEYANGLNDTEYTGYITIFHLYGSDIEHLSEIFSEMRESTKDTEEYLDHFYDTGKERVRK